MAESSFDQTALNVNSGSTPIAPPVPANSSMEIRPLSRALIPYVAIVSVPIAPVVMYFVVLPSLKIILSALVLLLELGAFGYLWFALSPQFVRADETGITQSGMGKMRSVSWSDAESLEVFEHASWPQSIYEIKNKYGETVLDFSDFGNKTDGAKMRDFIAAQLARN